MSDLRSTDSAADNQYGSVIVAECTDSRALCIDNSHMGCCVYVQVQGKQIRQLLCAAQLMGRMGLIEVIVQLRLMRHEET